MTNSVGRKQKVGIMYVNRKPVSTSMGIFVVFVILIFSLVAKFAFKKSNDYVNKSTKKAVVKPHKQIDVIKSKQVIKRGTVLKRHMVQKVKSSKTEFIPKDKIPPNRIHSYYGHRLHTTIRKGAIISFEHFRD